MVAKRTTKFWQRLFNISNPLAQKDWLFENDKLLVNKFIKFENIHQEEFAGINFKTFRNKSKHCKIKNKFFKKKRLKITSRWIMNY